MSAQQGLVVHFTRDDIDSWQTALRNLQNLVQDDSVSTPTDQMEVVVNGPAVRFLLSTASESSKITHMINAGVRVHACGNSLDRFDHAPEALTEGVTVVSSGVAEVVRAQQQQRNYLRLP